MIRKLRGRVLACGAIWLAGWMPSGDPRASDRPFLPGGDRDAVDLAICLDTSGSMESLIDAARLKLWEIVNDLALAEPTPRLRVALLTYGNPANNAKQGWVRVEAPLTEDLDLVSQRLFELTTAGGVEYVGRVVRVALDNLDWTDSDAALKIVFVAGNEDADQDPLADFPALGETASDGNIVVNAIYCGSPDHADAESWREVARLAAGQFATIDHRRGTVVVATPFDDELAELGSSINDTYIPLGEAGLQGQGNQALQDRNAQSLNVATAASRAVTKSSPLYSCDWDLIDALQAEAVTLEGLEEGELPETMRQMSFAERQIYIEDMALRRAEIRERISELNAKRRAYVAEAMKSRNLDDSRSFDAAVRRALRQQIEDRGLGLSVP